MSTNFSIPSKAHQRVSSVGTSQILGRSRAQSHFQNGNHKSNIVSDISASLKRRSGAELGAGTSRAACNTSFVQFIEWIRSERLASLPHKGSRWDKVLIRAQYFAEKLNSFNEAIAGFTLDSNDAAEIGFGHAKLLLELGHDNSRALDTVFAFLYKLSLQVAALVARSELLGITTKTREELSLLYSDLLTLVTEVAIRLYKMVHGMLSSRTSLDLFEVFGDTISTINDRCARITHEIWTFQIENEGLDIEDSVHVKTLERWLSPQDQVLASLSKDHTTFSDQQAEFTCLWFQKHLSRFIQGQSETLLINGKAGSGKTVLGASIVDRLQRPVARRVFSTVYSSISAGIPTQATLLNLLKSLLQQLLALRTGNMAIYNALARAYKHSRSCSDTAKFEEHLWEALTEALQHPLDSADSLVIVVDGLDELAGGASVAQNTLERLVQTTQSGRNVKLVLLSEALNLPKAVEGYQITISPEDIRDDLREVTLRALSDDKPFKHQEDYDQEDTISRITEAAQGSFVWAILVCEILEVQKSKGETEYSKTLSQLETSRPSVQELTNRLVTALNPTEEGKTILGWLLAAQRPLTTSELKTLFSIDYQKLTFADRSPNIPQTLKVLRPLLSVHDEVVRLRHRLVADAVQQSVDQKKITLPLRDYRADFALRILAYQKLVLTEQREPTLDDFDQTLADRLFRRHSLLEYSVRYWTIHLPKKPDGEFSLTPEYEKLLSDNVLLPLLEWLCLEAELSTREALRRHISISLLRSRVLTEKSFIVLQTYLIIASYQQLLEQHTDAAKYYYLATKVSTDLFGPTALTVTICKHFLAITDSWKFTSRTESFTFKEYVLRTLTTAYTHQYGATSEVVLSLHTTLAELYQAISEEDNARRIYLLIRKVTADFDDDHDDDDIHDDDDSGTGGLGVVVRRKQRKDDDGNYGHGYFFDEDEHDVIQVVDIKHIIVLIRRAETLVSRKEWFKAERIWVELWQQLSFRCRSTRSVEWHKKKIEVALKYAKFLHTQKREIETSYILTCIWQEYEHHELSFTQDLVEEFLHVAKFLKSINQHATALSIFKYASSYYRSMSKRDTKTITEIEEEVAITSTELVKQSMSSTTTTTTTTEITETVSQSTFRSVFQSMITNKTKTVDKTTISLAKRITSTYIEKQEWNEAITIINMTFSRVWSSFLHENVHSVTLTSTFLEESVGMVEQLAICYLNLRQLEKVEDIYVRLFQATLTSRKPTDALFEKARTLIIAFYDKHGYTDKSIKVLQELLTVYKKTLEPNHKHTITTLYELGSRCRGHARSHPYWIEYYIQILALLNKDSKVCHHDAMEASSIVTTVYWEDRRYAEAVTVYAVLWNTFVTNAKGYSQFSETKSVKDLYERYFQCLEESRTDLEVLYKVTKEYHETCVKVFGATASITIDATIALAQVSQRSEMYSSEAIALFESLTKTSSISSTRMTTIKRELRSLYTREIASKKTTVTKENIEKAISIYQEQLNEYKSSFGYSNITTLSTMRQLVQFYHKQEKHEHIIKEIDTAVLEILTKETQSQKLIESASHIAETLMVIKQEEHTRLLIEELHSQIIAHHKHSSKFSFDLTSVGRRAIVFVASLEYSVRSDLQVTLTEITADLMYEAFHFDHFRGLITANDALDKIIIAAAPLRAFLFRKKHLSIVNRVEAEIVDLFVRRDTAKLKLRSPTHSPRLFIVAILDHLGNKDSKNFIHSVIHASNENVLGLTKKGQFNEAYDVGNCAFLFALHHQGYERAQTISQGFKLGLLLAGRGGAQRCQDQELRKLMLQLSNKVVKEILSISKKKEINLAKVHIDELSELAALLGEQEDFATLEWLLSTLWSTRDVQKSWSGPTLLSLGRRLVMARFLCGSHIKAIRLAEDIAYNLRRTQSIKSPATLSFYELLAQLYTSVGQQYQSGTGKHDKTTAQGYFKKALLLQEDLLKTFVYEGTADDEDDDELESTAAILSQYGSVRGSDDGQYREVESSQSFDEAAFVRDHLRHWKLSYQRYGDFVKSKGDNEKLNRDLFHKYGGALKGMEGVEKWSAKGFGAGKAESSEGAFVKPEQWEFVDKAVASDVEEL